MAESILQSYNGLIRFYDGTIIAIEDQEYSSDGKYNWEKTFNPNDHISTLDGITPLYGHRFKRVKHSGDTNFQLAYRIIPEEPLFRVQDMILQYKLETEPDSAWKDLLDTTILQGNDGAKGEQGIPGTGWYIDQIGYYKLRPDCGNHLLSTGCQSCNRGDNTSTDFYTFLSLGDGVLVLDAALISAGTITIDLVAFTHFSNDLLVWTPITGGVVDFKVRYLATNGTGAVYIDMRNKNYYGSRGNVYVCADGTWTLLSNVATPTYMVGERSASTNIGYLNNFVDEGDFEVLPQTITLIDGKLVLIQASVDETAFATNTFGDGITQVVGSKPLVNASDFAGFGLTTYISDADSTEDLQVTISPLLGDGLVAQAGISIDNESHDLARVDLTALVNNNSGLITEVQVDTFRDLKVNLGNGLQFDSSTPKKIEVLPDNLSLMVDASNIRVKPYALTGDGIRRVHLNPDIIWTNKGLGFDVTQGLYVRIDTLAGTIGYNGSGELQVPLNGITGDRLNDNVADNTKAIEVSNDKLVVKYDNTSIGVNGSGELYYKGSAGLVVSSIYADGKVLRDQIVYTVSSPTTSILPVLQSASNVGDDTLNLQIDINTAWLDGYIGATVIGDTAWADLTGLPAENSDLVSYINSFGFAKLNTWYGKAQIHSTFGLVVKSVGGLTYKIIVDDNGNLDTELVTIA